MGIPTENFRFSWNMISIDRNVDQTAYQIVLVDDESNFMKGK